MCKMFTSVNVNPAAVLLHPIDTKAPGCRADSYVSTALAFGGLKVHMHFVTLTIHVQYF